MLRISFILDQFKKELRHGAEDYTNYFPMITSDLDRDDLAVCIDSFCEIVAYQDFNDFPELEKYLNDDDNRYFSDSVSERADSSVNVYNFDLRQWAVTHYDWVEEALSEFGWEGCGSDYHRSIMMGQYLMYQRGINDVSEAFKAYISEKYKF